MSRYFYKYKDIRKLNNSSISSEIFNGSIITATPDMAKAISLYYGPIKTWGANPDSEIDVRDIHLVVKKLISEWDTDIRDVKNYLLVRNAIDKYVDSNESESDDNTLLRTYLSRNAYEIWNSIKLLAEMGLSYDDISDEITGQVKILKSIWKNLKNPLVDKFYYDLESKFSKEYINQKIQDECEENNKPKDLKDDIYLIGFYFITPLQNRIFDMLERAGYNLHFLLCINDSYDYSNKIWERNTNNKIEDIQSGTILNNYYGDYLKGQITSKDIPIKVHRHKSDFEYISYVENALNKGEMVFSPNVKSAEELIRSYYPEYVKKNKLLSYPIGQYLYNLLMLIKVSEDGRKTEISFNNILRCFSSGCVKTEYSGSKINGRDFLYEMSVLKPFFKNCHSFSDCYDIFQSLSESIKLKEMFDLEEEETDKYSSLKNPFNYIAALNIPLNILKQIAELIDVIYEDLYSLVAMEDRSSLYDYFQKTICIIEKRASCDSEADLKIKDFLITSLLDENSKGVLCNINSVKDAIVHLISEDYAEYQSFDMETVYSRGKVMPLTAVESAMLSNYGQQIHLILADEYGMPGAPDRLPWPLSINILESIKNKISDNRKKYIEDKLFIIKNRPLANRYLFYAFMGISNIENNVDICIEWIAEDESKEIEVSPYVKILGIVPEETDEDKLKTFDNIHIDNQYVQIKNNDEDNSLIDEAELEKMPALAKLDNELCKYRYIYSYELNEGPSYSTEFHHGFLISKLTAAICISCGYNTGEIVDRICDIFSYKSKTERKESAKYVPGKEKVNERILGEENKDDDSWANDTGYSILPHFLDYKVVKGALRISDEVFDKCMYCPYGNICLNRYENFNEENKISSNGLLSDELYLDEENEDE